MSEIQTSTPKNNYPITLDKAFKVLVPRPKKSRTKQEKDVEEEVLVVEGIELRGDVFVKFDVLINNEDDEVVSGADKTEFAGIFVNVPCSKRAEESNGEMVKMIKTQLRLGINELLEDLGAENDEHVFVTLMPKCEGCAGVSVVGIKIELEYLKSCNPKIFTLNQEQEDNHS